MRLGRLRVTRDRGQVLVLFSVVMMLLATLMLGISQFVFAMMDAERARSEVVRRVDLGTRVTTYGDQTCDAQVGCKWGQIDVLVNANTKSGWIGIGGYLRCWVVGTYSNAYFGSYVLYDNGMTYAYPFAQCWAVDLGDIVSGAMLRKVRAFVVPGSKREIALEFQFDYPVRFYGIRKHVSFFIRRALSQ